jgi:flagellar motor switch protein FliN/FliY
MATTEEIGLSADPKGAERSSAGSAKMPGGRSAKKTNEAPKGDAKSPYEFSDLSQPKRAKAPADMDFILDVPLEISVELGQTRMQIHELLKLSQGSIIALTKNAGESLEILANRRLIARGEVVVANEKYGIRVTEIISPVERVEKLK